MLLSYLYLGIAMEKTDLIPSHPFTLKPFYFGASIILLNLPPLLEF
jgi:hypothetical protein